MPVLEILEVVVPPAVQLISTLINAFRGDPDKTAEVVAIYDRVMQILGPEAAAEVEARLQREEAFREAARIIAEGRRGEAVPQPQPLVATLPLRLEPSPEHLAECTSPAAGRALLPGEHVCGETPVPAEPPK